MTPAQALGNPRSFGTTLLLCMIDSFGTEFLEWDPHTVEIEARQMGVEPKGGVLDRVQAASAVLSSNAFHTTFETWNNIVRALNFDHIDGSLLVPAGIDDAAWGCAEARLLEGPEESDAQGFGRDIAVYVGTMLSASGITKPPSMLSFAVFDADETLRRDIVLSSDEFMMKSYWDRVADANRSVEEALEANTRELLSQIRGLSLRNGKTDFVDKILEGMSKVRS